MMCWQRIRICRPELFRMTLLHPIVVKVNGAEKTSKYTGYSSLPVTVGSESLNRKFVITFGKRLRQILMGR